MKDKICAQGKNYLEELAEELLPGAGTTEIGIIVQNHPGDIKSCFTDFFNVWNERDTESTWQKLIDALRYTNKYSLASDIEKMLILPQHSPDELIEGQNIAGYSYIMQSYLQYKKAWPSKV